MVNTRKYALIFVAALTGIFLIVASDYVWWHFFLEKRTQLGAEWILSMQREDGLFHYEYFPFRVKYSEENNIVRQAGAAYALSKLALFYEDEKYVLGAKKAIDGLLTISQTRSVGGRTLRFVPFGGTIKGNTNALLVLAILDLIKAEPRFSEEYFSALNELSRHIVASQNQDGLFFGKYDIEKGNYFASSDYNNGESFLALVELYKIFPEAGYAKTIARAAPALMEQYGGDWNKAFYAWGAQGFVGLYSLLPNPEYREFIFRKTDLMMDTDYFRKDKTTIALAVFLEALGPVYMLAKETRDWERAAKYGSAMIRALRNLSILQVTEPANFGGGVFLVAKGGFCIKLPCTNLRIDNTQHGVSAYIAARQSVINSAPFIQ